MHRATCVLLRAVLCIVLVAAVAAAQPCPAYTGLPDGATDSVRLSDDYCMFVLPPWSSCAQQASVHSEGENDAAVSLADGSTAVLGGFVTTTMSGTQPVWFDGSSFDFDNFIGGAAAQRETGYIVLRSGSSRWSVKMDISAAVVLCKQSIPAPPTTVTQPPPTTTTTTTTAAPTTVTTTTTNTTVAATTTTTEAATTTTPLPPPETNATTTSTIPVVTDATNITTSTTAAATTNASTTTAFPTTTTSVPTTTTPPPTTTEAPPATPAPVETCDNLSLLVAPSTAVAASWLIDDVSVTPLHAAVIPVTGVGLSDRHTLAALDVDVVVSADDSSDACGDSGPDGSSSTIATRFVCDAAGSCGIPMPAAWASQTAAQRFAVCVRPTAAASAAASAAAAIGCPSSTNQPLSSQQRVRGSIRVDPAGDVQARGVDHVAAGRESDDGPMSSLATATADGGAILVSRDACTTKSSGVAAVASISTQLPLSWPAVAAAQVRLVPKPQAGLAASSSVCGSGSQPTVGNVTVIAVSAESVTLAIPCPALDAALAATTVTDDGATGNFTLCFGASRLSGIDVRFADKPSLSAPDALQSDGMMTFWARGSELAPDATVRLAANFVGSNPTVHFVSCSYAASAAAAPSTLDYDCNGDRQAADGIDRSMWKPVPLVALSGNESSSSASNAAFSLVSESHLARPLQGRSVCACLGHTTSGATTVYTAVPPTTLRLNVIPPVATSVRLESGEATTLTEAARNKNAALEFRLPFAYAGTLTLTGDLGFAAATEGLSLVRCPATTSSTQNEDTTATSRLVFLTGRLYGLPNGRDALAYADPALASLGAVTAAPVCFYSHELAQTNPAAMLVTIESPAGRYMTASGDAVQSVELSAGVAVDVHLAVSSIAAGAPGDVAPAIEARIPVTSMDEEVVPVPEGSWLATGPDPRVVVASLYSDATCDPASRVLPRYFPLTRAVTPTRVRFLPGDFAALHHATPTAPVDLHWCAAVAVGRDSSNSGNATSSAGEPRLVVPPARIPLNATASVRPTVAPDRRATFAASVVESLSASAAALSDDSTTITAPRGSYVTLALAQQPLAAGDARRNVADERPRALVVRESVSTTVHGMAPTRNADGSVVWHVSFAMPRAAEAVVVHGVLPGDEHIDDAVAVAMHVDVDRDFELILREDRTAAAGTAPASTAASCAAVSQFVPVVSGTGAASSSTLTVAVGQPTLFRAIDAGEKPIAPGCRLRLAFALDGSCSLARGAVDVVVGANGAFSTAFGVVPTGSARLCAAEPDTTDFAAVTSSTVTVAVVATPPVLATSRPRFGPSATTSIDVAVFGGSTVAAFANEQQLALPEASTEDCASASASDATTLTASGTALFSPEQRSRLQQLNGAVCFFAGGTALGRPVPESVATSLLASASQAAVSSLLWPAVVVRVSATAQGAITIPSPLEVTDGTELAFLGTSTTCTDLPASAPIAGRVSASRFSLRPAVAADLDEAAVAAGFFRRAVCVSNAATQSWQELGLVILTINDAAPKTITEVAVTRDQGVATDVVIPASSPITAIASSAHVALVPLAGGGRNNNTSTSKRCDATLTSPDDANSLVSHRPRRVNIETDGSIIIRLSDAVPSATSYAVCLTFADGRDVAMRNAPPPAAVSASVSGAVTGALVDLRVDLRVIPATVDWSAVLAPQNTSADALQGTMAAASEIVAAPVTSSDANNASTPQQPTAAMSVFVDSVPVAASTAALKNPVMTVALRGVELRAPRARRDPAPALVARDMYAVSSTCATAAGDALCVMLPNRQLRCGCMAPDGIAANSAVIATSSGGAAAVAAVAVAPTVGTWDSVHLGVLALSNNAGRAGLVAGAFADDVISAEFARPVAGIATPASWPHVSAVEARIAASSSATADEVLCQQCRRDADDMDDYLLWRLRWSARVPPVPQGSLALWRSRSEGRTPKFVVALPHTANTAVAPDTSKVIFALPVAADIPDGVVARLELGAHGQRMATLLMPAVVQDVTQEVILRLAGSTATPTTNTAVASATTSVGPEQRGDDATLYYPGGVVNVRIAVAGASAARGAADVLVGLAPRAADTASSSAATSLRCARMGSAIRQELHAGGDSSLLLDFPPSAMFSAAIAADALPSAMRPTQGRVEEYVLCASIDSGATWMHVSDVAESTSPAAPRATIRVAAADITTMRFDTTLVLAPPAGRASTVALTAATGTPTEVLVMAAKDSEPRLTVCDSQSFAAIGAVPVVQPAAALTATPFGTISVPASFAQRTSSNTLVCVRAASPAAPRGSSSSNRSSSDDNVAQKYVAATVALQFVDSAPQTATRAAVFWGPSTVVSPPRVQAYICDRVLRLASSRCAEGVIVSAVASQAAACTLANQSACQAQNDGDVGTPAYMTAVSVLVRPSLFSALPEQQRVDRADAIVQDLWRAVVTQQDNNLGATEAALFDAQTGALVEPRAIRGASLRRPKSLNGGDGSGDGTDGGDTDGSHDRKANVPDGGPYYIAFLCLVVPSTAFVMYKACTTEEEGRRIAEMEARERHVAAGTGGIETGDAKAKHTASAAPQTSSTTTSPQLSTSGTTAKARAKAVHEAKMRRAAALSNDERHDDPLYDASDAKPAGPEASAAAAAAAARSASEATSLAVDEGVTGATPSPSPRRPGEEERPAGAAAVTMAQAPPPPVVATTPPPAAARFLRASSSSRGGSPSVRGKYGVIAAEPERVDEEEATFALQVAAEEESKPDGSAVDDDNAAGVSDASPAGATSSPPGSLPETASAIPEDQSAASEDKTPRVAAAASFASASDEGSTVVPLPRSDTAEPGITPDGSSATVDAAASSPPNTAATPPQNVVASGLETGRRSGGPLATTSRTTDDEVLLPTPQRPRPEAASPGEDEDDDDPLYDG